VIAANGGGYDDLGLPQPCGVPFTSQIPRLTNEQYDRTVRDLLGVTRLTAFDGQAPSALLEPNDSGEMTDASWSAYMKVAEAIAAQVMADSALRGRFLACTPTGDGNECLHQTIIRFGRRAFRRPLTDAEVARFDKIVDARGQITATGAAAEVAEVLLQTFLVSPSFLQRAEIAETPSSPDRGADGRPLFDLSSTEIASRLSYTFWGSTPDEELQRAADANELLDGGWVLTQADRMLQDEKAREIVAAFHRFYLHWDESTALVTPKKDATLFPGFDDRAIAAASDETARFFDAITFEHNGSIADLFTSPIAFVNATTAPFYGLDAAAFGPDLTEVKLEATERPGFLTRLAFLSTYAHPDRTAPVLRGVFIMQNIVGMSVGPPPPNGASTPLPQGSQFHTNRERVTAQTSGASCSGCHQTYLDPPGFVLEAYNAVGAFQTVEADSGAPIDTVADVYLDGKPVRIQNPSELMNTLSISREVWKTYARRWVSYAFARSPNPMDECAGDQLDNNGPNIQSLLGAITRVESFTKRARGNQ
jgi:hypothetical protein